MSFIDLATLTLHRRNEMEARIKDFTSKCDQAIQDIMKLKSQAQGFVQQLNCDPTELKERFLHGMRTLDEFIYLITDFNLSVSRLEEIKGSIEYTPVQDTSMRPMVPTPAFNIMDMLSEPTPSTSSACPNLCPLRHKSRKVPKSQQTLIVFSSTSSSSESMPMKNLIEKNEQVQCDLPKQMKKISLTDPVSPDSSLVASDVCRLPQQSVLQMDQTYPATIMSVDGPSLWIITEDTDEAFQLMTEMTNYYKNEKNRVELSLEDIKLLGCCAYYDAESDCYYRGLFIRLTEDDEPKPEVFLIDTGEVCYAQARSSIQPLALRFCTSPPYARCCHLAGVELDGDHGPERAQFLEQFLPKYVGMHCEIQVDDNSSESLGVYVILSENETLNNLFVKEWLAWSGNNSLSTSTPNEAASELAALDTEDMAAGPEYVDPVEAVTGYSCRDEMDICKHYKGGSEKTCFKGARCKKRHVLKHPDGWTLDRVEVVGKCPACPLPAPGTWHRALVTCVPHFDRVYVQLVKDNGSAEDETPLPDFGVILPPTNLNALVRDMNSPASKLAYKPLKIMPAPGELVAALYPLDSQWYRARVLSVTRADQNVEVMYIDYGNVVWVKEDAIRALEPRYASLPAQALPCALAGVLPKGHDSRQWAAAKHQLAEMTQDRTLDLHVISRGYDEVTVELFDEQGYSVAEQLAALHFVTLGDCNLTPVSDSARSTQIVVP